MEGFLVEPLILRIQVRRPLSCQCDVRHLRSCQSDGIVLVMMGLEIPRIESAQKRRRRMSNEIENCDRSLKIFVLSYSSRNDDSGSVPGAPEQWPWCDTEWRQVYDNGFLVRNLRCASTDHWPGPPR